MDLSYITTYTKVHFNPIEPNSDDIKIADIAHALSLLCRANGHFEDFFSVAQHSLNCAKEASARKYSKRVQLGCLLHDASEAYISDITRPVKKHLPQYLAFEEKLQNVIWEKFIGQPLTEEERGLIREIDDTQLFLEFFHLMGDTSDTSKPNLLSEPDFQARDVKQVEKQFLSLFHSLVSIDKEFLCVGIDSCNGTWLAVAIMPSNFEVGKYKTIDEICEKYSHADSMIIDMPIGLPKNQTEAANRPDQYLRKLMKGKASSVFSVPSRSAVYEDDKQAAKMKNIQQLGKSLSEQSLSIRKSIRQIDDFLQSNPQWKNKLLESHPEYAFTVLNKGTPVLERKVEKAGEQKRMGLLIEFYPRSREVVQSYLDAVPGRKKADDVIDALCLAVIGKEGLKRGFRSVPDAPVKDSTGLLMQIVVADILDYI